MPHIQSVMDKETGKEGEIVIPEESVCTVVFPIRKEAK